VTTTLHAQLEYYRSQHRTKGCEMCHLIGVPLIALAFPALLFNWRTSVKLFSLGWAFQFLGHFAFEKNKPVLFGQAGDPMTVLAALIYVSNGWSRLLLGRDLIDESDHNPLLTIASGRDPEN